MISSLVIFLKKFIVIIIIWKTEVKVGENLSLLINSPNTLTSQANGDRKFMQSPTLVQGPKQLGHLLLFWDALAVSWIGNRAGWIQTSAFKGCWHCRWLNPLQHRPLCIFIYLKAKISERERGQTQIFHLLAFSSNARAGLDRQPGAQSSLWAGLKVCRAQSALWQGTWVSYIASLLCCHALPPVPVASKKLLWFVWVLVSLSLSASCP